MKTLLVGWWLGSLFGAIVSTVSYNLIDLIGLPSTTTEGLFKIAVLCWFGVIGCATSCVAWNTKDR